MARSRLQSKEGKCCDAILHLLEREFGARRGALRFPEREQDSAPVELVCPIGDVQVAIEHTRVEAYPDQIRDGVQFVTALEGLEQDLAGQLPAHSFFQLGVPSGSFEGLSRKEVEAIRAKVRAWVIATVPAMDPGQRFEARRVELPGVPFLVELQRASGLPLLAGRLKIARFMPTDLEAKRLERVRRALDAKLPKLSAWKARGALSVLVLENDDIALSNVQLISTALRSADPDPALLPDRIYEVDTPTSTWIVWTLRRAPEEGVRIGATEYHDVDPAGLQDVLA